MKRTVISIILCLAFVLLPVACNSSAGKGGSGPAQDSDLFDLSGCEIMTPASAAGSVKSGAETLANVINNRFGTSVSVSRFNAFAGKTDKIIIGNDKLADAGVDLSGLSGNYAVFVSDGAVIIYGSDNQAILKAIKEFIDGSIMTADRNDTAIRINNVTDNGGEKYTMLDNLHEIVTEKIGTIYQPAATNTAEQCTYSKIIKLEHNGEKNGMLIATRETVGADDISYPIYRSTDNGESWRKAAVVTDKYNDDGKLGWQPFLYELPCDIGDMKEGTVILAGCSRNASGALVRSTITMFRSADCGKTWEGFAAIATAGGIDAGVWEPFLTYEESTGRIYCFYSEDFSPSHSQQLVYKYTTDMINWSEKKEAVSCSNPSLRPGMISIAKLGNGKYFAVFEMVGIDGNPIYRKTIDSLDDWGDVSDYGKKVKSTDGKVFGSSPWCAWSPSGGECGTLFVTGKHMVEGKSDTGTDMFVSFDYGKTFYSIDNPIKYTLNDSTRCGYSAGMYVDGEGTLYYVNDTNYGPSNEKMMFAIIKSK